MFVIHKLWKLVGIEEESNSSQEFMAIEDLLLLVSVGIESFQYLTLGPDLKEYFPLAL